MKCSVYIATSTDGYIATPYGGNWLHTAGDLNADTWVVEIDNQVIGFIALIGNEIGGIFLQPEYQGKKIGKLMMDKAQEIHGDLEVEVFVKNSIGRKFYSQYGFELLEEKTHEPTGEKILHLKFTSNK